MASMGTIYARGNVLWMAFEDASGERQWASTKLRVGDETKAEELLAKVEARVRAERENAAGAGETSDGPLTVQVHGERWIKRRARQIRSHAIEANLLRRALAVVGHHLLAELRPRHVRDMVLTLAAAATPPPAPRTLNKIYRTLRQCLSDAVFDELIASNPADSLPKGTLPKNRDADPAWRATAVFTRAELVALMDDELVPADRRVLYAILGLAGLRFGEAAGLRWSDVNASAKPLGRISVTQTSGRAGTKTGVSRSVPIHPTLAAILAEWKLSGWAGHYGRAVVAGDLVVPTLRHNVRQRKDASVARARDLGKLGFRSRRGHDLRRTFISLAQADGAQPHLLKHVTHGGSGGGDIMGEYTSLSWETLCEQVALLRVRRRRTKKAA